MHPSRGNLVTIKRPVVDYARVAHAFSAGIKCQHCKSYSPAQVNLASFVWNQDLSNEWSM